IISVGTIGCASTRQAGSSSPLSTSSNSENSTSTPNTTGNQTSTPGGQSSTSPSQNAPQQTGPVLSASNASLNFGDVKVGASSSLMVTLTNTGTENVNVLS